MFTAVFANLSRRNHHAQLCLSSISAARSIRSLRQSRHLPDWFYEQVCSYAENADPAWREQAIQELVQFLGPLCTRTGSRLTFSHSLRDGFFRRGYVCFKAAAEVLAQTAFSVFSGSEIAPAFDLALDGLNDSYEDRYSIYIYHAQTGILEPLDRWLRYADLSKPVYIGGVVSYYR